MRLGLAILVFATVVLPWSVGYGGGATMTEVTGQGFIANFYHTDDSQKKLGIVVLGGSDGGKPDWLATALADQGYPVLSLAYFKVAGTPEYLDMIPLEYFDKPITWLGNNEKIRRAMIAVVGVSKGAELALLLASRKPQIRGVIAIAPSSVVWQGIPKTFWPPRSSWSLGGQQVPFVPYVYGKGSDPNDVLGLYRQSLMQKEQVQKAAIEVEKIGGPILLLSGQQDNLWPSAEMGDMICKRLKESQFKYKYEHVKYDDAGHTLNEHYMLGGTSDGNKRAREESTKKMLEFLNAMQVE
jgi:dienelactone hydrolase